MQLKDLQPIHYSRKSRRVGRGGKRGTYSGKGIKGQRSRSGARIRPHIRDLIKRIPKLRGVGFSRPQKRKAAIVNIGHLEQKFTTGERVTPTTLNARGLINPRGGRLPEVKLLGSGTLTRKLFVADCQISKTAREKIEKVGGTIINRE